MTTATGTSKRDETIKTIRNALRARSGKTWSVTGGRGTDWGWITITSAPARRAEYGYISEADRVELAQLLDLESVHHQGVHVPASREYWQEYVDRAEGRTPSVLGEVYWD